MTDDEERELKGKLLMADIANKTADTALKDEQRRWEPVKAMSTAFGAGVAVATGLIAVITWVVIHIIQVGK